MDSLSQRAERALLGALLLGAGRTAALPRLESSDFADRAHRDLFTMLTTGPGQIGSVFGSEYLDDLQRSCPDPGHAPAYGRMVIEAALRRQLTGHALRLELGAGDMHHHARRLTETTRPGGSAEELLKQDLLTGEGRAEPSVERLLSHQLLVSLAIRAHVKAFNPDTESAEPPHTHATTEALPVPSAGVAAWTAAASAPLRAGDAAALLEEQVLASTLRRAPQAGVTGWLPAEAFIAGPRRDLYTAILALCARGEPVDELTADWERARHQALPADGQAVDTTYARRLAGMRTDPAQALRAAHRLFSQCLSTACTPTGLPVVGAIEPAPARPSANAVVAIPLIPPPGLSRSGPEPRM